MKHDDSDTVLRPSRSIDPSLLDERDLLYGIWRDVRFLRNVVMVGLILYAGLLTVGVVAIGAAING